MKTILITGSTDGIGKLAAIKLAQDGYEIYLHGRNAEKLTNTISEIKQLSGNNNINGFASDFSDMKSVNKMADEINAKLSKIDVLINNAGVFKSSVDKTIDGLDIRLAVNYFAPYILTKTILPLLQKGTESRIINLSSAAQSTVQKGTLNGEATVNMSEAYAQSKLALTMWSFDLAKKRNDITVLAVNPGSLLNTRMVAEAYGQHWAPAEKGADILYDLVVNKDYQDDSGKYFDNDKGSFGPAHPDSYDEGLINKLIQETEKILHSKI